MSLINNNGKKEFSKEMLVKVSDEDLRNFLGYRELSNHFIGGIKDERLRGFFFEKKCKDVKSLTTLEVEDIIFNEITTKNIDNIKNSIYELNLDLEFFIDSLDDILDDAHNKRKLKPQKINLYIKELYQMLDDLNNFIETNLIHLNPVLIERLDNRSKGILKSILSKIQLLTRSLDEFETLFGTRKDFAKFKNKFNNGFIQFLKLQIEK